MRQIERPGPAVSLVPVFASGSQGMYEKSPNLGSPSMRSTGRRGATTFWLAVLTLAPALAAASEPAAASDQIWKFTARFHAVVLHLPIGLLGFVYLLEFYALLRPSTELRRIITLALVSTSLGAVAVAALGLLLAREGGYDDRTLNWHKWLGLAFVALTVTATVFQIRAYRRQATPSSRLVYRGFLATTAVLLTLAGHYGGNLTHGSQYLTKYAPDFVKKLVSNEDPSGALASTAAEAESYFTENIRPILAAKCYGCHGPDKQKGDYRADLPRAVFAAGESGQLAIVPGAPLESYLVQLIMLPGEHEDAMPPRGKEALTSEEILRIAHWVQNGATIVEGNELAQADVEPAEADDSHTAEAQATHPNASQPDDPGRNANAHDGAVDFATQIGPILEANCIRCHSKKRRKGRLALHDLKSALKGGKEHGPAVAPGDPKGSSLLALITVDDIDLLMPPEGDGDPLKANEIELIRRWLEDGAAWPEGVILKKPDEAGKLATRG